MTRDLTKMDLSCDRYKMKQLPPNGLKVLDTFCGAGVGEAGMRLAGYETVYAFDIKEYAVKSYNYNYGKPAGYAEDIAHVKDVRFLTKKDFPSGIDVITGGFPCFVAGTLIMTDKGYKKIEDIRKGDKVLTHTNSFKEVVIPMKNKADHIYKIKTMCSEDLFATEEHPFYVRKKNKDKNTFNPPKWIPVKDLNDDYYVGIAINKNSRLPNTNNSTINKLLKEKDFWWLVGKYFDKGYIVQVGTFKEFVLLYEDRKELKELKSILNNLFLEFEIDKKDLMISVKDTNLINALIEFGLKDKKLNDIILDLPKEQLESFLNGFFKETNKYIHDKELAYGIGQCVAKTLNIPYSLEYDNELDLYELYIDTDEGFYEDGYIWCPLYSVKRKEYDDYVYNFEVADDNSYTVNNIIVHNCQAFSTAGAGRGSEDKELGDLGLHFCRLVKEIQPRAFLLENVGGLINKKHKPFFFKLMMELRKAGYILSMPLKENKKGKKVLTTINCWEYGVPQTRERVFVVGIRKDIGKKFVFPDIIPEKDRTNIRHAIGDLPDPDGLKNHVGYGIRNDELPFIDMVPIGGNWKDIPEWAQKEFLKGAFNSGGGRTGFLRKVDFDNPSWTITSVMDGKNNAQIIDNIDKYKIKVEKYLKVLSQDEYFEGGFSSRYLSRNRQRQWDEPSFTIVSEGRQLPLYPEPSNYDIRRKEYYDSLGIQPPRRFTVRECLRLQTVPDWFLFPEDITLKQQYERCSGIPSLIAYKFGIEIANLIK